ncbi:hypothetical protein FJ422_23100 [Mesorhizobium sp. B2-6-3]|nr:hypothetical protein FJW11_24755 [Mesorhizobium sp. B3-1-1]TPJ58353.1 hypothetical protein FJ462_30875 [Mesorhizobium sp. B2-6-7]TPJ80711.1 hypothetical protein FJ422_23100 [Mesorhizobium sp. B2-6-3]TPJ95161.1 hypothetical protein FJ491_24325 [Mesorhizobium sp. B2-5-10]TPK05210.1 hypothetical protein FJ490_28350 [Mesorhizobium sp. B2-5-11]TPK28314.1 hypothetical protein FJ885_25825 [Mesorhizobium sp. B2-5-8]
MIEIGTSWQSCAPGGKASRNEACPCGSGKKYKHCHGGFHVKAQRFPSPRHYTGRRCPKGG